MNVKRILSLKLPKRQSIFLWGARKTGKTTYLKQVFPSSIYYNFLETDLFISFSKEPYLLRQQLLAKENKQLQYPVILDEVQKIPQVLDEVHWLIENKGLSFILCGSSARKLKRGRANLLGGRAWKAELFPFVSAELHEIDLLKVLNHGLIPTHYLQDDVSCAKSLKAYIEDYLKEEIFAEGLSRNIPAFSRFFDAAGYSHGELVNYANIARDCAIDSKTVKEYFQILSDTLLGTLLEPYKKRQNRQVIAKAPKFYLFDVGVAGAVTKRHISEAKGEMFGRAFEHFIFMEIKAYSSYSGKDFQINYWRTKYGMEIDFVLNEGEVIVEVKGTTRVESSDLKGINAFCSDNKPKKSLLVCREKEERLAGSARIVPWRKFLSQLWSGEII